MCRGVGTRRRASMPVAPHHGTCAQPPDARLAVCEISRQGKAKRRSARISLSAVGANSFANRFSIHCMRRLSGRLREQARSHRDPWFAGSERMSQGNECAVAWVRADGHPCRSPHTTTPALSLPARVWRCVGYLGRDKQQRKLSTDFTIRCRSEFIRESIFHSLHASAERAPSRASSLPPGSVVCG
jgi:hypothetical protein